MAYVTKQEMIDRYGEQEVLQLTDRVSAGIIDDIILGRAIDDASAETDSYLSARYLVPVPASDVLSLHVADIARYLLYDDQAPEEVKDRYRSALAWLRDVRDGKIPLDGAIDADSAGGPRPASGDRTIVFGDDCLGKMPGVTCP